jgi:hypothetical protein
MLVNGKTAIDAVAAFAAGFAALGCRGLAPAPPGCQRQMRIGRSMFLTVISPPSWNRTSMRLPMRSLTIEEMQIPPGSASGSRRAAILTPSP